MGLLRNGASPEAFKNKFEKRSLERSITGWGKDDIFEISITKANGMRGLYNSSDKKIMALIDMLDGNYPDHLSEKQKGEYLVGYYQQRSANIKDAEEKKNRKAAKIETNNTDTATTVATQKEK